MASAGFHRLLVRNFDGGPYPFVPKGGHGMFARTLDARRTRDIDIVTDGLDISAALRELRSLVSRGMGDFLSYEVAGYGSIKTGDRYRDGCSVSVSVAFGGRAMRPISIDLVSDEVECGRPEYLTPADLGMAIDAGTWPRDTVYSSNRSECVPVLDAVRMSLPLSTA